MIRVALVLADDPRKPYRPGQERRLRGEGRVSIQSVENITLGDITRSQARALGHTEARGQRNAVDLFQRAWIAEHDAKWLNRDGYDRGEAAQRGRFTQRWAWREARLVSYVPVEQPRFMASGRGQIDPTGNGDYTPNRSRSIDPDAECVDQAWQDRFAQHAVASRQNFQAALKAARSEQAADRGRAMRERAA